MVFHEGQGDGSDHGIDNQPYAKGIAKRRGEDPAKIEPNEARSSHHGAMFSRSIPRGFSSRMTANQSKRSHKPFASAPREPPKVADQRTQ